MTTAPRYVADQRPAADAAATRTETRPATTVAVPAVGPPSPTQAGAISKSVVLALRAAEPSAAVSPDRVERRLKPYGVVMLPHGPSGERPEAKVAPKPKESAAPAAPPSGPPKPAGPMLATTQAIPMAQAMQPQTNAPDDQALSDGPALPDDGDPAQRASDRIDPPVKASPS
jgi:hypothetical protein